MSFGCGGAGRFAACVQECIRDFLCEAILALDLPWPPCARPTHQRPRPDFARTAALAVFLFTVVRCPLLAQSGHAELHCTCPLSGAKRTWLLAVRMSAFDPKRTLSSVSSGCGLDPRVGLPLIVTPDLLAEDPSLNYHQTELFIVAVLPLMTASRKRGGRNENHHRVGGPCSGDVG